MNSDERSHLHGGDDWRIRITTGAAVAACMGAAMALGPTLGINGFWPGMLAIASAMIVGIVIGRLVGRRLFSSPCQGMLDKPRQP